MSDERRCAAHVVSGSLIIRTPSKQEVLSSSLHFILHATRVLQFSSFSFFFSLYLLPFWIIMQISSGIKWYVSPWWCSRQIESLIKLITPCLPHPVVPSSPLRPPSPPPPSRCPTICKRHLFYFLEGFWKEGSTSYICHYTSSCGVQVCRGGREERCWDHTLGFFPFLQNSPRLTDCGVFRWRNKQAGGHAGWRTHLPKRPAMRGGWGGWFQSTGINTCSRRWLPFETF